MNRQANVDDRDDQPTLRFSADSFPRLARRIYPVKCTSCDGKGKVTDAK